MPAFLIALFLWMPLAAFDVDGFDRFILEALKEEEVPGASVVVVQGGKTIFLKGYGLREIGKEGLVDPETIFQLASVSKTFTSAGLGLLVDRKVLDFDRAVILDFPEFSLSDIYAKCHATPRDLLAHRTGLPSFTGDLLCHLGYTNAEIVQRVRKISFETTFREQALYSNIGFFLAGELTAKASGMTWKEWINKEFIRPLGMSRTGFNPLLEDKNTAASHGKVDGKIRTIERNVDNHFTAAGGVVSCAADLAKWMQLFLQKGKGILSEETVKQLFTPAMVAQPGFTEVSPINASPFFCYSLGWGNYVYKDQLILEKGGALDGVRTIVVLVPGMDMGIAVLCNLNLCLFPEKVRAKCLELVIGPSGTNMQAEISRLSKEIAGLISPPEPIEHPLPSRPLAAYTGEYESALYGTAQIKLTQDQLEFVIGPAHYPGTLKHYSSDTFLLAWPLLNLGISKAAFTLDPQGNALYLTIEEFGTFTRKKTSDH